MSAWQILLPAFALSILLLLTHTYLGLHVLARGIIFIDLALAQIAALGVSLAILAGESAHGAQAQRFALIATLLAAFGFAKLRQMPSKTAREVVIGSIYVITTALSIVVLSRSAHGTEELKALLNGNVLWVRWDEIAELAVVSAGFAALHWTWRNRFLALSFRAETDAAPSFLWEALFFATFAVIITLAVNVAGVLVVFAFLIIPAFSASLLAETMGARLLIGWLLGTLGCLAGLSLAYRADLPVGATVVSVFGFVPLAALALQLAVKTVARGRGRLQPAGEAAREGLERARGIEPPS